jgi:hypothetical protein
VGKKRSSFVTLPQLWLTDNPRVPNPEALEALRAAIVSDGLTDALVVWDNPNPNNPDQRYEVLKGNRRTEAIRLIAEFDPVTFNEHFPEGKIPADVRTNLTDEEALAIKLDHGTQLGLSNWFELYLSVMLHIRARGGSWKLAEAPVVKACRTIFDRVKPLSGKAKDRTEKLLEAIEAARKANDLRALGMAEKEAEKDYFETRRGMIQAIRATALSPTIVEASRYAQYVRGAPEGFDLDDLIPTLSDKEIKKLKKAHDVDLDEANPDNMDDGVRKYNRESPGPNFWKVWNEIKAAKAAAVKSDTPRPKAMSAKAMLDMTKDGASALSKVRILTLRQCAGQEAPGLSEADRRAHEADVLYKHAPDEWAAISAKAKEILAEVQKAGQQAASAEEATKQTS